MVKQVKPLSDAENIGFGLLCGFTDVALFQPMNYWKNAVQQSLPFTLNPSLLYRGVAANLANNSFCVGAQFWLNGVWRKMITGGVNRDLSNIEKVGGGVFAGAASSVVAGPIELVMIQQQRKGGTLLDTTLKMLQGGHIFRGTIAMAAREGLYAGGYLGVMPVARQYVQDNYKDSIGATPDLARFSAAMMFTPFVSVFSHPPDTIKTCLQGDVEQTTYKGYMQTTQHIIKERGIATLWAGFPWRVGRQILCLMLFDKMVVTLQPIMFPHLFEQEKKK